MIDFDAGDYLNEVGSLPDAEIDLVKAAFALCAHEHEGLSFDRYFNQVKKLADDVAQRHAALLAEGAADDAGARLAALKHILIDQERFGGDNTGDDAPVLVDLIAVMDRQPGQPAALCLLFIQIGRMQGWQLDGLAMPGHFICRLEKDGERIVFDPETCAKILNAADLRAMVKERHGAQAELSAAYHESLSNRDILIRLQNVVKSRFIEDEEYERAVRVVENMRKIDPKEFRLLLDAGVLYAKIGENLAAARSLEGYIERAPNPRDRQQAALLLQQVRDEL